MLVTGAAAGMGYLYAERAVMEGAASVVLWDRDAEALAVTAGHLRDAGGEEAVIETTVIDLADPGRIAEGAVHLLQGGVPDVVINNAGIVTGNRWFWETAESEAERILTVNSLAPIQLTRALLPAMIADGGRAKRILNIASAAGTLANPRMSVYAASKWALYGWSDSVRLELQRAGHRHVSVTTFCPSYVSTGMFDGAKGMVLTPVITPEDAVDRAWRAMLQGRPLLLSPRAVNLAKLLRGVLPVRLWDRTAELLGVYSSMDDFVGRPGHDASTETTETTETTERAGGLDSSAALDEDSERVPQRVARLRGSGARS